MNAMTRADRLAAVEPKLYKISCRLKAQHGSGGLTVTVEAKSYSKALAALSEQHPEINLPTCALVEIVR